MKRGLQTKLARKTGLSDAYISQLLNGYRTVSANAAQRLADATNSNPLVWLYGTSDEKRNAIKNLLIDNK